jgi:hypothetical protein
MADEGAFIVKPDVPAGTVTVTGPELGWVVIVTFAGMLIGKTSPEAALGPVVPPTTSIVVAAEAVPITWSARVIVLNAQLSTGGVPGFPVP